MTTDQAKQFAKDARGLFPTMTADQAKVIAERVIQYDYPTSLAALKTHAVTHEYVNLPQLWEGLRTAQLRRVGVIEQRRREKTADALRRLARTEWGDPGYQDKDDVSVILMHYNGCWRGLRDSSIPHLGIQSMREEIRRIVRGALIEVGMDHIDASELARGVVELGPDEKIQLRETAVTVEAPGVPARSVSGVGSDSISRFHSDPAPVENESPVPASDGSRGKDVAPGGGS